MYLYTFVYNNVLFIHNNYFIPLGSGANSTVGQTTTAFTIFKIA